MLYFQNVNGENPWVHSFATFIEAKEGCENSDEKMLKEDGERQKKGSKKARMVGCVRTT